MADERKLIQSQIGSHGGTYHPDLTRQCTHLLCVSAAGKKYEAALKWDIPCVGIEWLFQSLERGMALEPKYFTLDIEPGKRGEGAWDRNAALKFSGVNESFETAFQEVEGGRKRKLRRVGSRVAQEGIWEGILGGVSDFSEANNQLTTNHSFRLPASVEEGVMTNELSMDIAISPNGLFDGMVFYTWGFTERQVSFFST